MKWLRASLSLSAADALRSSRASTKTRGEELDDMMDLVDCPVEPRSAGPFICDRWLVFCCCGFVQYKLWILAGIIRSTDKKWTGESNWHIDHGDAAHGVRIWSWIHARRVMTSSRHDDWDSNGLRKSTEDSNFSRTVYRVLHTTVIKLCCC